MKLLSRNRRPQTLATIPETAGATGRNAPTNLAGLVASRPANRTDAWKQTCAKEYDWYQAESRSPSANFPNW